MTAPMPTASAKGGYGRARLRQAIGRPSCRSCRPLAEHHAPERVDARLRAADLAGDPALVEADDAVRKRKNLVQRFGDEQNRAAPIAEGGDQAMDEGRPGDVDPARGLRGDKQLRFALEFAGDGEALLIAAGEAAGGIAERAETHRKPYERPLRLGVDRRTPQRPKRENAGSRSRPATKLSRMEAARQSPSSPRSALT